MAQNRQGASADAETGSRPSDQAPAGLDASRFDPARLRRTFTVYEKPKPARAILAEECGLSDEDAVAVLRALVRGGYGIAPRNPTNGMLVGYLEALTPPSGYEQVITAIGKARVRWQAMLAHGTEMALSRKFMGAIATEARRQRRLAPSKMRARAEGIAQTPPETNHE